MRDQNSIGWNHALAGRISHLWTAHQTTYLKQVKKITVPTGSTGDIWAKKLLLFLLLRFHNLWKLRNSHQHATDTAVKATSRRKHLEKEVRWIYSKRLQVDSTFHRPFRRTQEECLSLSISELEIYVATYKDFIIYGLQTSLKQAKSSHRSIASFFLPLGTGKKGDDRPP